MNHPTEDLLLLYAYGETADGDMEFVEDHVAACPACEVRLGEIERLRVKTERGFARPRRRDHRLMPVAAMLAAAAVLAVVVLARSGNPGRQALAITDRPILSPSGYFAGGPELAAIDSLLNTLERRVADANR